MSLDVANSIARQSLVATQGDLALSGRNIAAAGDPDRSRVGAVFATTVDGGVRIAGVRRAEDNALHARMVSATAATAREDALLEHLSTLSAIVGDPEDGVSPAARIGDLAAAVADYANQPDDPLLGRQAVERARQLAQTFNDASATLLRTRERADAALGESVAEVNRLLLDFERANDRVVNGTVTGRDVTMDLDRRDAIVAKLSEHLGVTALRRADNDMALYTDGGITLFDKSPRVVAFTPTPVYAAGTVGAGVTVDGLAITGPDAPMPSAGGALVGHARIRDEIVPTLQRQLDEMARVLEATFADGPGSLFVTAGPPGEAGTLRVAASVDPLQGGTVENLRDGSGNVAGHAAYADRLLALGTALETPTVFDPATGLGSPLTLAAFAAQSVGWLEGLRADVDGEAAKERSVLQATSDALSSVTGVNMDDEYARQLAIERNYAASARLIGIIDEMYAALLEIV